MGIYPIYGVCKICLTEVCKHFGSQYEKLCECKNFDNAEFEKYDEYKPIETVKQIMKRLKK